MRGTIRVRLTALYSGLFLLTSTILLVVTNLLLSNVLRSKVTAITNGATLSSGFPADNGTAAAAGIAGTMGTAVGPDAGSPAPGAPNLYAGRLQIVSRLPDAVLDYQWTVALITVAALTLVSIAAGWWLAGRLLRPLHQITATAHRLSVLNLHERISLPGPRDELRELADTFDEMLGRLERAVEAQRRFIANAAHELRTPLAVQRAAIQIGLTDPAPERLPRVRAQLLFANQRMERLIESLLLLAQSERGLGHAEPVDLAALVHQAASEAIAAEAERADVALTVTARETPAWGDPVLLQRLVGNLLDNAVRHNRPGGSVDVQLSTAGVLTVRNSGPEVPEERIAEIFEPFRRLGTPRTSRGAGSGLGLSLVRSIAAMHQLTLTAVPNPGGGLIVTVHFLVPAPQPALSRSVSTSAGSRLHRW
ncbi:HAMP domain-containing sensor histidine kinase [Frankia sp. R82]|uniref:sensor histidine kinase n=1 Tax=Frankia sp. R82 TaxID=2950553 RepID=UPI002043822A|nr:HAMP domain-containing sensor histidine kinase [Frankia sp. R82]MCM3884258.1 HAMP domain-containing histidine kinase [Frankia sp. R82]